MKEIQTPFGRLAKGKLIYIKITLLVVALILVALIAVNSNYFGNSESNQNDNPTTVPFALGPNSEPNVSAPTESQPSN